MPISKIFLDLDGTILDGKERHYHCYQNILNELGYQPIGIDEYWKLKRAMLNRRELLAKSGAQGIYDVFLNNWMRDIESKDMLDLDIVHKGAISCLRKWHDHGIELVLVTMRKNKIALEQQLLSTGLSQYLDCVLVSDHVDGGVGKANVVRLTYPKESFIENVLWIGDTEVDWSAAQSLGCNIVLTSNGLRNHEYLSSLNNSHVVSSIATLKDEIIH